MALFSARRSETNSSSNHSNSSSKNNNKNNNTHQLQQQQEAPRMVFATTPPSNRRSHSPPQLLHSNASNSNSNTSKRSNNSHLDFLEQGWDSDVMGDDEHSSTQQKHQQKNSMKNQQGGLPRVIEADDEGSIQSAQSSHQLSNRTHRTTTLVISVLILVLTIGTSVAFVAVGVKGARDREEDDFYRDSVDVVNKLRSSWEDYVNAASWVHGRCRSNTFSRTDFKEMYEYLVAGGLDFKAVQFDPYVPHAERDAREAEAREYYQTNYPDVEYQGFRGFEPGIPGLSKRSNQSFYYPIHYNEPVLGNEAALGLDYWSSESRQQTVKDILSTGQPATTPRLLLVKSNDAVNRCTPDDADAYGVVLMHPGVNLTTQRDVWPHEFSSIVICMPQLLFKSTLKQGNSAKIYIHDYSSLDDEMGPSFLGALQVDVSEPYGSKGRFVLLDEVGYNQLNHDQNLAYHEIITITNRQWAITILPVSGTYEPELIFVIMGGVIICVAGVCLALWVFSNTRRMTKFNLLKAAAEAEKAQLILDNARQATKNERELNDFIAHEVRNPVASAMAACSFIKSNVHKEPPLADEESKQTTREDVNVIDNALKFINDLLRNMLDMHRAADKQLKVEKAPANILHDVLEPVHAMLNQKRDKNIDFQIECNPQKLLVVTDRLRLKQVMLNLGRNSSKFVHHGFIRLRAEVVDDYVQLSVEDSGSGIPKEKRERLFSKFQESLDRLNQGTGIGLFLCKNLVELMGGEISLDDDYDSGVPGCPGTRFVVNLKEPLIHPDDESGVFLMNGQDDDDDDDDDIGELNIGDLDDDDEDDDDEDIDDKDDPMVRDLLDGDITDDTMGTSLATTTNDANPPRKTLPNQLSVLLVDDDATLRKMFSRAIRTVAPEWIFRQAASGEAALQITETEQFDLIFMDMYMASVEKQLLGTETVTEMRERGVTSRICGLSANDKELDFLEAGADVFTMKPFPCAADPLTAELLRVLYSPRPGDQNPVDVIHLGKVDKKTQQKESQTIT